MLFISHNSPVWEWFAYFAHAPEMSLVNFIVQPCCPVDVIVEEVNLVLIAVLVP